MSIPTLTLRSIKNRDTGIDLASPSVQEVEAPLGGTSVEYEVSVVTRLPLFKTQLHKNEDVVHFSVYKAYREVEDLHCKLQKKYCLKDLPSIPKQRQILSTSTEEKRLAIDALMLYIAKSELLSSSSIFIQFLGISPQKQRSLSSAAPVEDVVSADDKSSNETTNVGEEREKTRALSEVLWPENKEKPSLSVVGNIDLFMSAEPVTTEDTTDNKEEVEEEESADDLFLKVKDYKQKSKHPLSDENFKNEKVIVQTSHNCSTEDDDVDLFEEVQRIKENEKTGTDLFDTKKKTHHGLFDGIDDGGSPFFGINVSSKGSDVLTPQSSSSDSDTKSEISIEKYTSIEILPASRSTTEKPSMEFTGGHSNVSTISEQRKLGDISLFQGQDFGDSITIDEEPLFLVSQTKEKGMKKNPLLSPKTNVVVAGDVEGNENLDDLLNLAPLPSVPRAAKQSLFPETPDDTNVIPKQKGNSVAPSIGLQKPDLFSESPGSQKHQILKPEVSKRNSDARSRPSDFNKTVQQLSSAFKPTEPKEVHPERPVPMPRSRPPPPKLKKKPEVLPRRVSLGKPSLPPKPVPPPKPKPPGIAQKPSVPKPLDSKTSSTEVQRKINDAAGELNSFDILQYIEQEEKSSLTEESLFD